MLKFRSYKLRDDTDVPVINDDGLTIFRNSSNTLIDVLNDGTVTYQANNSFVGTDSFSYVISDEDDDAITVSSVNTSITRNINSQ